MTTELAELQLGNINCDSMIDSSFPWGQLKAGDVHSKDEDFPI